MSVLQKLAGGMRALLQRDERNEEIDEELRGFVESSIDDKMRRGMTREEAERAARAEVGSAAMVRHKVWSVGWESLAESVLQDFLYAFRSARRSPLLSIVAIAALSLGIGLNAGVFTLLNAMFLTPPTQKDPGSFVQIYPHYEGWSQGVDRSFTTEDYDALRGRSTALEEVAAWQWTSTVLEQAAQGLQTLLVSCNYFTVFGDNRPLIGRLLVADDCKRSVTTQVALLDESVWRHQFNANEKIVGETIHLNGLPFTVVGIVRTGGMNVRPGRIYAPYTVEPALDRHSTSLLTSPDSPWLEIAARLRPRFSRTSAQAEIDGIMREQDRVWLERKVSTLNRKTTVVLTNGAFIQNPAIHDMIEVLLTLIMGPLSLVLLLACSNVTMLFLSRGMVRRGEMAVRLALGAGRKRLFRTLIVECLLTALIAGVISMVLANYMPQIIMNALDPASAFTTLQTKIDWHVFGYLAALVAIAGVMSSIAPTQAAWGLDLVSALKGRDGAVTTRSKLTNSLIVAQVAMSFVLLAAAVLFARLPAKVTGMDPGFDMHHLLDVPLDVDTTQEGHAQAANFQKSVAERIRAIPGVQSLAYTDLRPFFRIPPAEVRLPGQEKGHGIPATLDRVSADFFSTFGIGLLRGRSFLSTDWTSSGSGAAVLSAAFAKRYWPGSDPIGKVVITPGDRQYRVVGVATDMRSERFGVLDGPRVYLLRDPASLDGQLFVRFAGSSSTIETAVRDAVKALDPTMLTAPQTIWEALVSDAEQMRSFARIIVAMASLAILLAITGIYAVLSFAMQQRSRDFGIRMVLGANRASIFRSIMIRGGLQIASGLILGVLLATPAAWSFAHLAKGSPVPFQSFDVSVYGIAAALLITVSITAMYLPALRATQVDPMIALRAE
jgi:predicted permease